MFCQPKHPTFHNQMSTHQCNLGPQNHLQVGSSTRLRLHHYKVRVIHKRQALSGGGFTSYSGTSGSGGFKFGSSKGGSEFAIFPGINTEHVSGE